MLSHTLRFSRNKSNLCKIVLIFSMLLGALHGTQKKTNISNKVQNVVLVMSVYLHATKIKSKRSLRINDTLFRNERDSIYFFIVLECCLNLLAYCSSISELYNKKKRYVDLIFYFSYCNAFNIKLLLPKLLCIYLLSSYHHQYQGI